MCCCGKEGKVIARGEYYEGLRIRPVLLRRPARGCLAARAGIHEASRMGALHQTAPTLPIQPLPASPTIWLCYTLVVQGKPSKAPPGPKALAKQFKSSILVIIRDHRRDYQCHGYLHHPAPQQKLAAGWRSVLNPELAARLGNGAPKQCQASRRSECYCTWRFGKHSQRKGRPDAAPREGKYLCLLLMGCLAWRACQIGWNMGQKRRLGRMGWAAGAPCAHPPGC